MRDQLNISIISFVSCTTFQISSAVQEPLSSPESDDAELLAGGVLAAGAELPPPEEPLPELEPRPPEPLPEPEEDDAAGTGSGSGRISMACSS